MNLSTQLRHKLSIQAKTGSFDALGQPLESWDEVCAPWGDIRNLNGVESIKANAIASAVQVSIRIRYRTGLDASMRVVHGAKTYQINAILPDEQGRVFMDLACTVVA